MRVLGFLLILVFIHTLPLWNTHDHIAGGYGDPFAHTVIPKWYCSKVLLGDLHQTNFLAPGGYNASTSYDSPFPFLLVCPFGGLGAQAQFHLFAFLQISLIVICAWLVARLLFKEQLWQLAYCLFAWWSGYYFARATQHFTLLSNIWGFQLLLWTFLSIRWKDWRNLFVRGLALGLIFSGTFQNAPLLFFPLVALLVNSMLEDRQNWRVYLRGFAVLGLGSMLIFLSLFWPPLVAVAKGDYASSAGAFNGLWDYDLLGTVLPWQRNLFYSWFDLKPFLQLENTNPFDWFFLAVFVISLGFWRFWKNRQRLILLAVALFSFFFALGPHVKFDKEILADSPLFGPISGLLPFSLCRTPGRFAFITATILVFIGFQFLREKIHSRKILTGLALFLIAWISFTGPYMNQEYWVPTFDNYRDFFPMKALEQLHDFPADSMVLNAPAMPAQDPSQNFMWLIHQKNINAGYISYAAYTQKAMAPLEEDPLLSKLSCGGDPLSFESTPFMQDMDLVRTKLLQLNAHALIFNKMVMGSPACKGLTDWIVTLAHQKWVHTMEENSYYLVLSF